ncbi:rod shape-determining protein MreC [Wenzhouxiangella limi]|uniref:Cell shape-determining protein MreC n=1 Tax=Wenzhouxiangella limi TaxID=2707351 RepID=A0A845V3D1_9GAMM|nr:rod shape-determining protein MreC [Wenzhouxiangella limi]
MNAPGGPFNFSAELAGRTSRLMIYALLAIILMTLDYRGRWVEQMRHQAGLVVEPAVLLIESPFRLANSIWSALRGRQQLLREIGELRGLLAESSARLLLLEELRRENLELRQLLSASKQPQVAFYPAEIRQVDLNPFSHRVLINRGRRDGVESGQAVIDAYGVVGQVDEVFLHSARVVLLTDPDHALPVAVERTGVRTIAYGSGLNTELRLNDLPMNVDLEASDRLVTSGLGGAFPAGLPVAEVIDVSRKVGEAFARARLRPLGRLDRSRHLLVLEATAAEDEPAQEDDATPSEEASREVQP